MTKIIPTLKTDAPLRSIEEDEFGLSEMVKGLARVVSERTPSVGYTLGIEGAWGSGKSTLANFVAQELLTVKNQHIIRFEPWLIGEKSALIASFLGQFAATVDEVSLKLWPWWSPRRWWALLSWRRLSKRIKKYGERLGALGTPVAGASALDPTGHAALVATGLKTTGLLASLIIGKEQTIEQLKSSIISGLRAMENHRPGLRFVILIDDTDRLDPSEAVEILRLVRKAADFPLVCYIICFDGEILSKQVTSAMNIDQGRDYLERIFQDVVHIPPQEPFALRRYLKRALKEAFPDEMASSDQERWFRLEMLFDRWCGRLITTPRDVVRLRQAVSLGWPQVPDGADFADFVWLQLLKMKWPELYEWTRNYVQNIGSYRDRGRPGDTEPTDEAAKLMGLLERFGWHKRLYLSAIDDFLPGLKSVLMNVNDDNQPQVYDFEEGELQRFERTRRLGSPSHWRGYFAFAIPSYAVSDSEILQLRKAAEADPTEAARLLRAAFERKHERAGHFLDVLLDRLADVEAKLTERERSGLLQALADVMDEVERKTQSVRAEGHSEIWNKARRLLRTNPPPNFASIVKNGSSLNWLADIMRDQGFAHGLPEGRSADTDRAWLDRTQFDESLRNIIKRFEAIGMKRIFEMPAPLDILFCWAQLGDADDVKARFAEATRTHADFLKGLEAMRGWSSNSATGISHPLYPKYITYFAEPAEVRARLERLATTRKSKHREPAKSLLASWRDD